MHKTKIWFVALAAAALATACGEPFLGTLPAVAPATTSGCEAATPSNLRGQVSGSAVHLQWDSGASGSSSFVIDRNDGASWAEILTLTDPATRNADDTSVDLDRRYQYRIHAVNGDCVTDPSTPITVYTAPLAPRFDQPVSLSTTALQLGWANLGQFVDHLELSRSTASAAATLIDGALATTSTARSDDGLAPDTEYTYQLVAVSPAGDADAQRSAPSVQQGWTLPQPATSLTVTHLSPLVFYVAWTDPNAHTVAAEIWRVPASGTAYEHTLDVTGGMSHFVDSSVQPGGGYRYQLLLRNPGGKSTAVGPVTIYAPPLAPSSFSAQFESPTTAHLTWASSSGALGGYQLWRARGAAAPELVTASLPATAIEILDTNLDLDTFYEYQLQAWSPPGDADAVASAATTAGLWTPPRPAVGFVASMDSSTSIELTWTDPNLSTTAAHLSRRLQTETNFAALATIDSATHGHRDSGLTAGTGYVYRLELEGPGGRSTAVEATGSTSAQPALSWLGDPSLDATCTLTILGQASFDSGAGVSFDSASGSIEHVAGVVTASEYGIEGVLTDLALGRIETSWTVVDSLGGHSTLARALRVEMLDAATLTALVAPTATINHDTNPGRQAMLPSLEVDSGTGCHGCAGGRGAIALNDAIAGAEGASCVLGRDSGVYCWGNGSHGRRGDGTTGGWSDWPGPVCASGQGPGCAPLRGVLSVTGGGGHSCALLVDQVRCWGDNDQGQVGDGTISMTGVSVPTAVCTVGSQPGCPTLGTAVALSLGERFSCALLDDGTVQCWGANSDGQLGNTSVVGSAIPLPVCASGSGSSCSGGAALDGVIGVYAQNASTCALRSNGEVWCWGDDGSGVLGDGYASEVDSPVPRPVCASGSHFDGSCVALDRVVAVSSRAAAVCALRDDGEVWCWGSNYRDELGDGAAGGTDTTRHFPAAVCASGSHVGGDCLRLSQVRSVALSGHDSDTGFACALMADSGIKCWGSNLARQLGADASQGSSALPLAVRVMTGTPCQGTAPELIGAVAIATGIDRACALLASGQVVCWGVTGLDGTSQVLSCAATPVCASGTGLACPPFEESAVRACGSVSIRVP